MALRGTHLDHGSQRYTLRPWLSDIQKVQHLRCKGVGQSSGGVPRGTGVRRVWSLSDVGWIDSCYDAARPSNQLPQPVEC